MGEERASPLHPRHPRARPEDRAWRRRAVGLLARKERTFPPRNVFGAAAFQRRHRV